MRKHSFPCLFFIPRLFFIVRHFSIVSSRLSSVSKPNSFQTSFNCQAFIFFPKVFSLIVFQLPVFSAFFFFFSLLQLLPFRPDTMFFFLFYIFTLIFYHFLLNYLLLPFQSEIRSFFWVLHFLTFLSNTISIFYFHFSL